MLSRAKENHGQRTKGAKSVIPHRTETKLTKKKPNRNYGVEKNNT